MSTPVETTPLSYLKTLRLSVLKKDRSTFNHRAHSSLEGIHHDYPTLRLNRASLG